MADVNPRLKHLSVVVVSERHFVIRPHRPGKPYQHRSRILFPWWANLNLPAPSEILKDMRHCHVFSHAIAEISVKNDRGSLAPSEPKERPELREPHYASPGGRLMQSTSPSSKQKQPPLQVKLIGFLISSAD